MAFDELTVAEWLDANVPGRQRRASGASTCGPRWRASSASTPTRLSALNLFYQYVEATPGADERYHVRGGNDQVPAAMAARLPGRRRSARTRPLEALFERADGSYGLRFGGIAEDVIADQVVLAIPFTTLRRVDLGGAGLSAKRRRCIDELGMGTNAKVLMQFDAPPQALRRLERLHVHRRPAARHLGEHPRPARSPEHRDHLLRRALGRRGAGSPTGPTHRPWSARCGATWRASASAGG